jgi:hypothetical protein
MRSLRNPRDVDEILTRLQGLKSTTPRRWGKMSAPQMVCHLSDAFRLYMGTISAAPPGFPYPSKLLRWGCLWIPVPWPKGYKTLAEVDQERGGTPPMEFKRDVAELKTQLDRFANLPRDFAWPAHPYLGRMSSREWMRLGYLHTNHHLRQFGV